MAVCYLAAMYAAIRAAMTGVIAEERRPGEPGNAVRRPVLRGWRAVQGIDRDGSSDGRAVRPGFIFDSWRQQWAARRGLYAGLAATTWIVVGLLLAQGPRAAVVGFSSGVSPWTYLLNQAQMITDYLRLAFWPDALVAFYGWPAPVTIAGVAPYLALIGSLIAATVAAWRWRPALAFLGAWFFVTLAPASSIVPVSTEVGAERRMYLPLMAVAILAAVAIDRAARWIASRADPSKRRVIRIAALATVLGAAALLASVTVARNREYESPLTLARTIVDRRPNAVAQHMLGEELALAGRPDDALPHLRAAVAGGNSRARYLLGQILATREQHGEAIEQLRGVRRHVQPAASSGAAMARAADHRRGARALSDGRGRSACAASGIGQKNRRADSRPACPSHIGAQGLLGDAMFARQQWGAALEHYAQYLARQPADTRAVINYGIAQVAVGRLDGAVEAFRRAADLDPANARARELLAMAEQDRSLRLNGSSK